MFRNIINSIRNGIRSNQIEREMNQFINLAENYWNGERFASSREERTWSSPSFIEVNLGETNESGFTLIARLPHIRGTATVTRTYNWIW